MKFLVDAQLPPALAHWMTAQGHEARHVFDIGLGSAADRVIAARAENDGATLVSKDEDFLLLRLPDRFALLWIRFGNCTTVNLLARLEPQWPTIVALLDHERLVEIR